MLYCLFSCVTLKSNYHLKLFCKEDFRNVFGVVIFVFFFEAISLLRLTSHYTSCLSFSLYKFFTYLKEQHLPIMLVYILDGFFFCKQIYLENIFLNNNYNNVVGIVVFIIVTLFYCNAHLNTQLVR